MKAIRSDINELSKKINKKKKTIINDAHCLSAGYMEEKIFSCSAASPLYCSPRINTYNSTNQIIPNSPF